MLKIFPGKRVFTAVDPGSAAIKTVSLSPVKKGFSIKKIAGYNGFSGLNPGERDFAGLTMLLKEAAQAAGLEQARVITALGPRETIIRPLLMPRMPRRELEKAIIWEAEKYIPLPVDDLILRCLVLDKLDKKEEEDVPQLSVLLVAAPRQIVYAYWEAFAQAGLTIAAIDLPALALWRVFGGVVAPAPAPGAYGVLEIGRTAAQFVAIRKRRLLFTRTLPLENGVENRLRPAGKAPGGIDREEGNLPASSERTGTFLSGLPGLPEVVPGTDPARQAEKVPVDQPGRANFSELIAEIRHLRDFYRLQEGGFPLEKLLLTGGGSKINGLAKFFQEELDIPVETGAPLLPVPGKQGEFQALDPALAVAAGLALREAVR